ncbi:MAG: HEAT repeat domain-containing protein [Coriobacteriales bacterium]|jgi:epoxyqueuosine reductase|nr:HEAT repeat domain-containing protein [Coriobacteriales bacterium]
MTLSTRIREYALDLGYDRVGLAPADDFDEFIEALAGRGEDYDWWTQGPRDPLSWGRPREKAGFARSIVVLVYNYARCRFPPELCALMGRVYQSRSYLAPPTNINGARLGLMRDFLAGEGLTCEDAIWLPQRWAGVRAGLVSFGKNTCAYAPGIGSFVLLSTLLVDAELDYDEPGPVSTCPKGCTLCLDACPTGALREPFTLVPRRCLPFNAWMTNKERGFGVTDSIPREIRPLMAQRVHGCDACQEACPRNRKVLAANDARPRDALLDLLAKELTLEGLLHMPEGYYESRVRPVMYNYIRDLRFFQRNAAVAIGNTRDLRYLPDLAQELDNPDATIRAHVAWALGQFAGPCRSPEARRLLSQRQAVEEDAEVAEELRLALEE